MKEVEKEVEKADIEPALESDTGDAGSVRQMVFPPPQGVQSPSVKPRAKRGKRGKSIYPMFGSVKETTAVAAMLLMGAPVYAGEFQDRTLGLSLLTGAVVGTLVPGPHQTARPTELVPRGSWIYDCLAGLALQNKIALPPEYFHGAYLLTRGEVASLLSALVEDELPSAPVQGAGSSMAIPAMTPISISSAGTAASPPAAASGMAGELVPESEAAPVDEPWQISGKPSLPLGAPRPYTGKDPRVLMLIRELHAELRLVGPNFARMTPPQNLGAIDGVYARAQLGLTHNRLHPRLMGQGHVEGTWDSFDYTASLTNLNRGAFERPFEMSTLVPGPLAAAARQLTYGPDASYLKGLERLAASRTFSGWRLEIGRDSLRWGPAYSGSLILSDNAGPLDMVLVSKNFKLGRLGTFRMHQFAAVDPEPGAKRFLIARRIEKSLSNTLDAAVSEMNVQTDSPDPMELVLPLYVTQHVKIKHDTSVDNQENYLVDFQLTYHDSRRRNVYGDVLLDDITLPWEFKGQFYAPRKAAFLAGMALPAVGGPIEKLIAEAVYTDGVTSTDGTYLHRNPLLADVRYGNVIGNPIGPDSEGIMLRSDFAPWGQLRMFAQVTIEEHHRHYSRPDTETALLISGMRPIKTGCSLVGSIKPVWVRNSGTAGVPGSRLEGQVYISGQF